MPMILFKAFSALLSYPTADMRAALAEISRVVEASPLISAREKRELGALMRELGEGDTLTAEARYVDLFDRGRSLSLHLFEHLHGESRDRGAAMVELKQLYEAAGFELVSHELPDYLPVVLEYLSCRDLSEARDLLADCAHILAAITRSLIARQSRYAAVLQALLVIAGEKPLNAAEIKPVKEHHAALDRDWAEQPAFEEPPGGRPKP
ncbi:nitrate reductase delta subunit [Mesorhizobium soli]|uniref:nitrate reductase molybdenum cofactor assembly chaperone n=1 Tax=Pseudaminobacter soli (ex Li et al. 2025) TaxID=1295366 RepID=UPI0024735867|nr:nitrate reductase molybdenum cofactor assembly chaperone [Mesorhizobium soli]MDH6234852.1 nitrate reductase delta subunit [Mesorhizobium soli]